MPRLPAYLQFRRLDEVNCGNFGGTRGVGAGQLQRCAEFWRTHAFYASFGALVSFGLPVFQFAGVSSHDRSTKAVCGGTLSCKAVR